MKNVLKMAALGCLLLSGYQVHSSDRKLEVTYGGSQYKIHPADQGDFVRLSRIRPDFMDSEEKARLKEILGVPLQDSSLNTSVNSSATSTKKTPPPVAPKPSKKVANQNQNMCSSSSCTPCSSSSSTRPHNTDNELKKMQDHLVAKRMAFNCMDSCHPDYQKLRSELEELSLALVQRLEEESALWQEEASLELARKLQALEKENDDMVREPIKPYNDGSKVTEVQLTSREIAEQLQEEENLRIVEKLQEEEQRIAKLILIYTNMKELSLTLEDAIILSEIELKAEERAALEAAILQELEVEAAGEMIRQLLNS